jgi:hypothetical protein
MKPKTVVSHSVGFSPPKTQKGHPSLRWGSDWVLRDWLWLRESSKRELRSDQISSLRSFASDSENRPTPCPWRVVV